MRRVSLGLVCVLVLAGCGGTIYLNKRYKHAVSTSTDKVLVMPVEAHRFPKALRSAIEQQVFAELVKAVGDRGISVGPVEGQLFSAGFGNLNWQLARGMYYLSAIKKSPEFKGTYYLWLDDLPEKALAFIGWVKGALTKAGAAVASARELRYILAAHVDRLSVSKDGKTLTFQVAGGIYDTQRSAVVVCHWFQAKSLATPEALRTALTGAGDRLLKAFAPVFY